MKMINQRDIVMGALAVSVFFALVFSFYTIGAYAREPATTEVSYEVTYEESGKLVHYGVFSNETVYQTGTSLEYYPAKITSAITGEYVYRVTPEKRGVYTITLHREYYVVSGKKKITIFNETTDIGRGDFIGTFKVPVTFNITAMNGDLDVIRKGTGLYRAQVDTYLTVEVKKSDGTSFFQRIDLVRDVSDMLMLEGTVKDYKNVVRHTNTTVNTMSFLGAEMSVSTARSVFPVAAILFMLPPLGFAYSKWERKKPDQLRGLRKFIVEGKPSEIGGDPIVLNSVDDLERVFDIVDKPIVHYVENGEDVYSIMEGELIYEYRVPREGG